MSRSGGEALFTCDVGNSRVAFALVVGGRIEQVVRVPLAGLDGLAECFRLDPRMSTARAEAAVIASSVNPAATERLRQVVSRFTSGPFLLARRDFAIPLETDVRFPDKVGTDRLLAALAAWQSTGAATIVVDAGTAVTVDAVDGTGRFLGGAILPGPALGAWALKERTAALPEVPLAGAAEPIGEDTESAIRAGLVLGAAGAIERLVAEQRNLLAGRGEPGERIKAIGTGGGLEALLAALRCLDEVRPNLVLEGLVASYLSER